MSLTNIRAALESHLQDLTGMPDIAWDNVPYDPEQNTDFVTATFQPVSTRPAHMGPTPQQYTEGLFIINIHTPKDSGPTAADDYVDLILNHFTVDDDLTYSGTIVRLRKAEPKAPMVLGNWYVMPVVVHYYCFY